MPLFLQFLCHIVIRAIQRDPKDMTEVWLIFANQTEEDILLREELEACVRASEGRYSALSNSHLNDAYRVKGENVHNLLGMICCTLLGSTIIISLIIWHSND